MDDEMKEEILEELKKAQKKLIIKSAVIMVTIGIVVSLFTGVVVYAINASEITYSPSDRTWNVSTVGQAINSLASSVQSPVGSIISYMGTSAPSGYLACDGSVYNIADYQELADHIKNDFGKYNYFGGDGINTFAVPDLRGEFLRGTGTNSHTNQGNGDSVGVHQDGTKFPGTQLYIAGSNDKSFQFIVPSETNFVKPENMDTENNSSGKRAWSQATNYYTSDSEFVDYTSRPTNTSVLYLIKY